MPMLYRYQAEAVVEEESSFWKSSNAGICCGDSTCFSALDACTVSRMMLSLAG